jgi:hypothetical protein
MLSSKTLRYSALSLDWYLETMAHQPKQADRPTNPASLVISIDRMLRAIHNPKERWWILVPSRMIIWHKHRIPHRDTSLLDLKIGRSSVIVST